MKRICIILVLILYTSLLFSQKEDYVWLFGTDQSAEPGIQALMIDWKDDPFNVQTKQLANGVTTDNTSISDADGNLLFWVNGCSVMNRNQEVMPHGDTLNWDEFREILNFDDCKTGFIGWQNTKIIPDPGNQDGFHIFHKTYKYNGQFEPNTIELRTSYVDMSLDDGLGDVIYFDSTLVEENLVTGHLEAIQASDNTNWWLIQPIQNQSLFLTFHIDSDGITQLPNQNSEVLFKRHRAGTGTSRFSPEGNEFVFYDYFLNVHLYDFDRSTGLLSNHQKIHVFDSEDLPDSDFRFGSVEWSPSGRFLYVSNRDSLLQIDTWEDDLQSGIRLIDTYDGTQNPFTNTFFLMNQAPDCKIYMSSSNGNKAWHVIHQPDELGTACDFVQNGLQFPQSASPVPTYPRFRMDEEDKCDPTIDFVFGEAVYYRRDLLVYPNPATDQITIAIPEDIGDSKMYIYDMQGNAILNRNISK